MNASGVIELSHETEPLQRAEFIPKSTSGVPQSVSRYRRLAESRSITPSPTPLIRDQTDAEVREIPEDFLVSSKTLDSVKHSDSFDVRELSDGSVEVRSSLVRIPSGECLSVPPVIKLPTIPSPISSSAESSPTVPPVKQSPLRPKLLNVPSILSSVVSRKLNGGNKNGNFHMLLS